MCCDPEDILEVEKINSEYFEHPPAQTDNPFSQIGVATTEYSAFNVKSNEDDEVTAATAYGDFYDDADKVKVTTQETHHSYTFETYTDAPVERKNETVEPIVTFDRVVTKREAVSDRLHSS